MPSFGISFSSAFDGSTSVRSFARPWATSIRNPSTPRSDQNARVRRKSSCTSGCFQLKSGCSVAKECRYHCPSGTRVHAGPEKIEVQSAGGSSPSFPRPSRKM